MGQSEEVRPFTSVSQVSCFREELDRKYMMLFRRQVELKRAEQKAELAYASAARRRKQEEKEARRKFPAPPFSGTEFIVPLADEGELADEGWIQHNCVASYRGFVWGGKACIYRVLKPERATLLIVRSRSDGMWRRRELKGLANAAVKRETENAVDAWLAEQQVLG
jgi:hypothetical protein